MRHSFAGAAIAAALTATPALADTVKITDPITTSTMSDARRDAEIKAVAAFYQFWNTGDEALLKSARRQILSIARCPRDGH